MGILLNQPSCATKELLDTIIIKSSHDEKNRNHLDFLIGFHLAQLRARANPLTVELWSPLENPRSPDGSWVL
jgi:hypothetical protein